VRGVVRDAWPPSPGATGDRAALDVGPGDQQLIEVSLRPTRRGDRPADRVTVRSIGPLGLAGRQGSHSVPWTLRVLPPFRSRRHPSRMARLRELDGRTALMVRGQGTEFDSLREYVGGDDVRSIDWRATARASDVMVRTWRPERDRRVLIVLDTGARPRRVGDAPADGHGRGLCWRPGDAPGIESICSPDRRPRATVGARRRRRSCLARRRQARLEPELLETDFRGLAVESCGGRTTLAGRAAHRPDAGPVEEAAPRTRPAHPPAHRAGRSRCGPRVAQMAAGRGDTEAVYGAAAAARPGRPVPRLPPARATWRHVVDAPPEGSRPPWPTPTCRLGSPASLTPSPSGQCAVDHVHHLVTLHQAQEPGEPSARLVKLSRRLSTSQVVGFGFHRSAAWRGERLPVRVTLRPWTDLRRDRRLARRRR
jgi:hypothetical protein